MNFFNNPIILCGALALGIVLVLVIVVVICCKRSSDKERDELKLLSEEIEADVCEEFEAETSDDKIESVLSKMQEALDMKEEEPISFEQEQEENAIISYQELLNSLGAKSSIDVSSIEVFDDELDSHVEISDFNKEIIDSYQKEDLDREIFKFQNDFSNENLSAEVVSESPIMNFDFSNVEFVDEIVDEVLDSVQVSDSKDDSIVEVSNQEVYEAKHVVGNAKKFKRTEIISPVYGIIDESKVVQAPVEDVEKIDFDDDNSLLDEF